MENRPVGFLLRFLLVVAASALFFSPAVAEEEAGGDPQVVMQDSLDRALLLLEMDTAAWAGTDQALPALQELIPSLTDELVHLGYTVDLLKDQWRFVFFYVTAEGDHFPAVEVRLPRPVTRSSRGAMKTFGTEEREILSGISLELAVVQRMSAEFFEKTTGLPRKPIFNQLTVGEEDGTYRTYFIPGDLTTGVSSLGPDLRVHCDSAGAVLDHQQIHSDSQMYRTVMESGQRRIPEKPPMEIRTPLPEVEDFLYLLLHPELAPMEVSGPAGDFTMAAGELPVPKGEKGGTRTQGERTETDESDADRWAIQVKEAEPDEVPFDLSKLNEELSLRASLLYFFSSISDGALQVMGGTVDCPNFPRPFDVILDFPESEGAEPKPVVFFFRPGEPAPCAAVAADGPHGDRNEWRYSRLEEIPPLSDPGRDDLAAIRAAKAEVDPLLGPGRHVYMSLPGGEEGVRMVYAWTEVRRTGQDLYFEDVVLLGSYVNVLTIKANRGFEVASVFVVEPDLLGWDTGRVTEKTKTEVKSAADPESGFIGEMEILRCRYNSHLCPRLVTHGKEFYLIDADGTVREIPQRKRKRYKKLDSAYSPYVAGRNETLRRYWKERATNRDSVPD